MARKLRLQYPGAIYRMTNRGGHRASGKYFTLFYVAFPPNRGKVDPVRRLERVLKIDLEWDCERGGVDGEARRGRIFERNL
jgi:hypothetical protein